MNPSYSDDWRPILSTTPQTLTELGPDLYELTLPVPFEEGHVNCFLLVSGAEVDLIDCGMNSPESIGMIRNAVKEVGGSSGHLRRLVVTHIHPDHYGAAGVLTAEDGAELYLHRLEVPLVHPRYLELEQLVAEVGRHLEVHGVPAAEADEMRNASRAMRNFVTPGHATAQLDGSEMLEMGGRDLWVEWTPGHSPGHVCLFDRRSRILFSGDQLLPDVSPNIGLHPQSTPNPLDDFLAGQQRLLALDPRLILPAHGRPFEDGAGKVRSLEAHHQRRKDQIVALLAGRELSGWEVSLELYGVRKHLWDQRMALGEALAHLQSLAVAGSIEKRLSPNAVSWLPTS